MPDQPYHRGIVRAERHFGDMYLPSPAKSQFLERLAQMGVGRHATGKGHARQTGIRCRPFQVVQQIDDYVVLDRGANVRQVIPDEVGFQGGLVPQEIPNGCFDA